MKAHRRTPPPPDRKAVAFAVLGAASKALHAARASGDTVALAALGAERLPADLEEGAVTVRLGGLLLARVRAVSLTRAAEEAARRSPIVARSVLTDPPKGRAWVLMLTEGGGAATVPVRPLATPPTVAAGALS